MQRQGANKEVIMSVCVEHTQKGDRGGYGASTLNGVRQKLHRIVFCEHHNVPVGSIQGSLVRHTCDNTRCINPEHLLLGTPQDNMDDKVTRGRQSKGRDLAHTVLSPQDVQYIREHYVVRSREFGTVALGRKFGVSSQAISKVVRGVSWKHVEDSPCTQVSG